MNAWKETKRGCWRASGYAMFGFLTLVGLAVVLLGVPLLLSQCAGG